MQRSEIPEEIELTGEITDMTIISHNFSLIHTFCMRFGYHKQLM